MVAMMTIVRALHAWGRLVARSSHGSRRPGHDLGRAMISLTAAIVSAAIFCLRGFPAFVVAPGGLAGTSAAVAGGSVAGADAGLSFGVAGSGDTGSASSAFCSGSPDSIASLTTPDGGICDCACSVLTGNSAKTSARVNVTSCQYSPPAFGTSIRWPVARLRRPSPVYRSINIRDASAPFCGWPEISPRSPVAVIFLDRHFAIKAFSAESMLRYCTSPALLRIARDMARRRRVLSRHVSENVLSLVAIHATASINVI